MDRVIGVSQQNYQQLCHRLEKNSGAARIKTLRKVADALGCEFVILLAPKSADTFAALSSQNRQLIAGRA